MKNQYLRDIERELDRLWVGHSHVMVIKLGCDKFMLSDGTTSLRAKGFEIVKITKRLHDKAGIDKFWRAMGPLKPSRTTKKSIVVEVSPVGAGRR